MKTRVIAPLMMLCLALGACQAGSEKQTGGTLVGAAAGGLIGAQFGDGGGQLAAVAIGTLAGAFLGSEIGKSLDNADRAAQAQAINQAQTAPLGQPIAWNNAQSGNSGQVVATRQGTNTQTGAYCREFEQQITVDGRTETQRDTACQQPDGSWKVLNP